MSMWSVRGGRELCGTVAIHGAKNAVLPLLAACTVIPGRVELTRCPCLSDVTVSCDILRELGCAVSRQGDGITVDAAPLSDCKITDGTAGKMRSSILFLGALLARCGEAAVAYPGGCVLGPRPIDYHLSALRQMGAVIEEQNGRLSARADHLRGAAITLEFPSVGATENILLAAVGAEGDTLIRNAAREPEITDLCRFLTAAGGAIEGIGSGDLLVHGGRPLHGCRYRVLPDRIEAATYLLAGAVTGGRVTADGIDPGLLGPIPAVLREMGCRLEQDETSLTLEAPRRLQSITPLFTRPHPGFPTDLQAPLMAALSVAAGTSAITETLFCERYRHVGELVRMGADIRVCDRTAVICGVPTLSGTRVTCTDLRGGAALMLAGLAAEGTTTLENIALIERGYDAMPETLKALGADVIITDT